MLHERGLLGGAPGPMLKHLWAEAATGAGATFCVGVCDGAESSPHLLHGLSARRAARLLACGACSRVLGGSVGTR